MKVNSTNQLEALASLLEMDADELREISRAMRDEKLSAKVKPNGCDPHVWELSWPIAPCEYTCLKCGTKTTN